ncbi:MAG: NifU family protein [Candidatus Omnitrophica bacterium]|nr:NifU family protein [Candidatus Omnitrophota bacterium]
MDEIKKIVDEEIRPMLQRDGGDLNIISYKDNVLKIDYKGSCCGCPHAAYGTLKFIESILKEKINPDIKVEMA